ncbi:hypothetical protein PUN28_008088 [Cardiocondyla obscurior]|uniref:Uncharacterized protein n=1 Tax=Cardiocondyla obscurior TaxID=286306 RepID=A0AAW2FW35_9HYME
MQDMHVNVIGNIEKKKKERNNPTPRLLERKDFSILPIVRNYRLSVDWLEITSSDLHSEICIYKKRKKKKNRERERENCAKRKHCAEDVRATIPSRMKIDQTRGSIANTKANISNMLYRRTIDT